MRRAAVYFYYFNSIIIIHHSNDGVSVLHYVASEGLLDVLKCMVMNINGHIMDEQYCDTKGRTVLHYAVKHIDVVKYLINECNCDIMTPDKDGVPVLHYVASEGLLDVLKCMVMNINGHIMDEQYCDTKGQTVLHYAVKHIDVLKYLINECNCDIMTPVKDGVPVLHYVASEGLLDVLKCMVMNINGHIMDKQYRDTNGQTVLHCAVKHIDVVKYLINKCNCDIMTPYKDGVPVLHFVASEGLLDVLKCMVMNINGHIMDKQYHDTNGQTVLHCAVKHIDVVKYLINKCNCDIMTPDKDGNTILHYVASKRSHNVLKYLNNTHHYPMTTINSGQTGAIKHIDVVKYLFNECNCDIMITDKDGVPVLHYVASEGLLDVLKCMVMNINGHIMDKQYHDTNGQTVLHHAVKHIDVVKYLINECNCNIMTPDNYGGTILHVAASEGSLDVMKYMVMNINGHIMDEQYHDTNGWTVLHYAVKHIDIVKYLINECNCDIMTPDKDGNTIVHYVVSKRSHNVLKYLINSHHYPMTTINRGQTGAVKHIDVVKYLFNECNCDIMATDKDGVPVLHYVASEGLLDVLKCMVMNIYGHIMDKQYRYTNDGRTVLHYAVKHIDVVKYLINECNCNIMTRDKCGDTILHVAASEGSLDVLKYMVMNINGHIMDKQYRDTNDRTVLHCAVKHIRVDVVKYLINECNCDVMITAKDGVPVLHYVASEGLLDVLKCMVMNINGHIMDKKYCDANGRTVLHCAVKHIDVVKYLINECNCDVMITDKDGVPVLHYVASEGLLDVLKRMVMNINGHIMDEQYRDTNGQTVLHRAVEHIDVVKYLINECNCDIMTPDKDGNTILHYVASKRLLNVLKYLINSHHYPMTTINSGQTGAVKHVDVVKYLFNECNCDIMITDKDGFPVLHYVASEGLLDVLKCIVMNINGHIMDKQYRDTNGRTVLHRAVKHIDVVKYLINECNCNIMVTNTDGWTPLHVATWLGTAEVIEYFLSIGNCDPLAKDNEGKTPLQLAKGRQYDSDTVIAIFKKFGNIKISHPIDSYVNVLLVGNPGAGKSTLSHVINDTATGSFVLGSFRNVGGVVPCTAGIIPYKLQHRTLGNIILHDFAGHSEYYSSHSAVIENLLQGSGGVFLIVVNILEKEAVKQLHQWLTVVRNEARKALNECHVIVIVSHVDKISNPVERRSRKEEIQDIIARERFDSVFLDCRKLGGNAVDSFLKMSSTACESIRSTRRNKSSLYHHEMYRLLAERKENILTLSDVMSAGKDNNDYVIPDKREDVLDALDSLHSTGLINVPKSEDKVWVVVNKGILLTEVDGILFAPKTFKEHVDIASNTGIVSVSGLTRLFPKYDPDMLICFLKNMELCQELDPSFLRMTNLIAGDREETGDGASETQRRGERLLFFPCLLSTDRPDEMTSEVYQFGWCLQCTREHDFFPPRYFHVLSLHLAFKFSLSKGNKELAEKLNRKCKFWSNGLHWFDGYGVGSLVEIVDESQYVLVMMSCEKDYSDNIVSLRRKVIREVMSVYKSSCPSLKVKELVIDPKELAYPVNTPRERTLYDVCDLLSAIKEGRPFLVSDKGHKELKEILPDESLSDISNLSLLGGPDIKVRINTHKLFDTLIQALIIKRSFLKLILFLIKLLSLCHNCGLSLCGFYY